MPSLSTSPEVLKWAPLLVFNRHEDHFPGEPEAFRKNCCFRQSNFSNRRDRTWNVAASRWENRDDGTPELRGAPWEKMAGLIEEETRALRPLGMRLDGSVCRPLDQRNLWGSADHRGFCMCLADGFNKRKSGTRAEMPVPIFHDIYEFTTIERRWTALVFWFFYMLNWYEILLTHQGDWEHITFYFDADSWGRGEGPSYLYYAAHEKGLLLDPDHKALTWNEDTHPSVFVLDGHASYPLVSQRERRDFTVSWATWKQEIPAIQDQPWAHYDGAWGAAGPTGWTTGPLGPLFKRGQDKVENAKRNP